STFHVKGTYLKPIRGKTSVVPSWKARGGKKPFGPTDAPGTVPSEEVAPSGGVAVSGLPTWANAGLQHNKGKAVAAIKKDLMEHFSDKSGRITSRAVASTAVREGAEAMTFFFITADR